MDNQATTEPKVPTVSKFEQKAEKAKMAAYKKLGLINLENANKAILDAYPLETLVQLDKNNRLFSSVPFDHATGFDFSMYDGDAGKGIAVAANIHNSGNFKDAPVVYVTPVQNPSALISESVDVALAELANKMNLKVLQSCTHAAKRVAAGESATLNYDPSLEAYFGSVSSGSTEPLKGGFINACPSVAAVMGKSSGTKTPETDLVIAALESAAVADSTGFGIFNKEGVADEVKTNIIDLINTWAKTAHKSKDETGKTISGPLDDATVARHIAYVEEVFANRNKTVEIEYTF